jgi:cell division septum initiation protein DivIVA
LSDYAVMVERVRQLEAEVVALRRQLAELRHRAGIPDSVAPAHTEASEAR